MSLLSQSPLQAQLIARVAEGCSKTGIKSWELRAQGYGIQLLGLQTLHPLSTLLR